MCINLTRRRLRVRRLSISPQIVAAPDDNHARKPESDRRAAQLSRRAPTRLALRPSPSSANCASRPLQLRPRAPLCQRAVGQGSYQSHRDFGHDIASHFQYRTGQQSKPGAKLLLAGIQSLWREDLNRFCGLVHIDSVIFRNRAQSVKPFLHLLVLHVIRLSFDS